MSPPWRVGPPTPRGLCPPPVRRGTTRLSRVVTVVGAVLYWLVRLPLLAATMLLSLAATALLLPLRVPSAQLLPRVARAARMTEADDGDATTSPLAALAETAVSPPVVTSTAACAEISPSERRRNLILAISSPVAAAAVYATQKLNPVNPVALLQRMETTSVALPDALATGRPTLVEFYAPWCVSCKESAPSMMRLEKQFSDKVNFVVINGDDPSNENLVRTFGVDGVPHLALIDGTRKLAGTLIGAVPDRVVEESVQALASGQPLPFGGGAGDGERAADQGAMFSVIKNGRW